jgi:DNA-binding Lrp family transcriptional regulator
MTTDLNGNSIILLKVAPGDVERTLKSIREQPHVTKAEAVLGQHDVAVEASFKSTDELQKFTAHVQAMDSVRGLRAYPGLQDWKSSDKTSHAASAYVLIRSIDPARSTTELSKLTGVERLIGTTGDLDVIARIGAENRNDMFSSIVKRVQGVSGVKSTETLPAFEQF